MKKLLSLTIAILMFTSISYAQNVMKQGDPHVVTMADGTKVVVVLVKRNDPSGKGKIEAASFTTSQLEEIKAKADAVYSSTVSKVDELIELIQNDVSINTSGLNWSDIGDVSK